MPNMKKYLLNFQNSCMSSSLLVIFNTFLNDFEITKIYFLMENRPNNPTCFLQNTATGWLKRSSPQAPLVDIGKKWNLFLREERRGANLKQKHFLLHAMEQKCPPLYPKQIGMCNIFNFWLFLKIAKFVTSFLRFASSDNMSDAAPPAANSNRKHTIEK